MKAFVLTRYSTPEKSFEFKDVPDPEPADHEIVIQAEAFGLNYADISARNGSYRDAPPKPCVIGYETTGRVIKIGKKVTTLKPGDRVAAFKRFGCYAELVLTPEIAAVKIPEDMDAGIALALMVQYCTAWYVCEEMVRMRKDEHVLVHAAAGGVGTALVQLAKRRGAVVYGTAGSDEKLKYLREQGVDHPINYRKEDFYQVIRKLRGEKGVDLAFDSLGGKTFRKSRKLLNYGGRIVGYGNAESSSGLGPISGLMTLLGFGFPSAAFLLLNSRGVIGVNMLRVGDHRPEVLREVMEAVVDCYARGEIKPVVSKVFPYTELPQAHAFIESRASVGKVIVKW